MTNAGDLRSLTQDMVNAYEDRIARIGAIRADTDQLLDAFHRENKGREREISKLLEGFRKEHKEMGTHLKADLSKAEAERIAQAQKEMKERQKEIKERVTEVSRMLEGFRKEQMEAAAVWQDLVATMQKRRVGALPKEKPPKKAKAEEVEE